MSDDYSYTRDVFEPIEERVKQDSLRRKGATRVQFGEDGIRMQPADALTVTALAAMLHEATIGCALYDHCERVHPADAANLLAALAPYLYRHPVIAEGATK